MIKINLANSLILKSGGKSTLNVEINIKQIAIKVALLILPLVGVMFWEKQAISNKLLELAAIQVQRDKLTKELDSFGSIDDMVRNVNNQKKDLDDKFNVMRKIFSLRSQKIQTLFELQQKIPPNTWLTQVLFHDKTVSVNGYASAIEEVQQFAGALMQNGDLFSSVNTTNTVAEKVNGGDYFKFDIFIKLKE
jgi:Tfp pilus assembly protein PilN